MVNVGWGWMFIVVFKFRRTMGESFFKKNRGMSISMRLARTPFFNYSIARLFMRFVFLLRVFSNQNFKIQPFFVN